jgi:hypothetical protein
MVGSDLVDIIDEKDVFLFATTRKEMRSKTFFIEFVISLFLIHMAIYS